VPPEGKLDPAGRRLNRLTKGALARLAGSDRFEKSKVGDTVTLSFPAGLAAEALIVLKLELGLGLAEGAWGDIRGRRASPATSWADLAPLAEGEPSNVLTTTDFARRLEALIDQGSRSRCWKRSILRSSACARFWPWAGLRKPVQGRGDAVEGRRPRSRPWR
jgi:hypothetical protein